MGQSRYHRQMLLPAIGARGQERLCGSHALLVGCGALGCGVADLLVRAGLGCITIVDRDIVELTNLQRQSLFDERDVREGLPKAAAAARRLREVNSEVRIRAIIADYAPENAERIAAGEAIGEESAAAPAQVIIDGTDNFETRYLMNDVAVKRSVPYIYGGAVASRGMQMVVRAGGAPCLRCIFDQMPAPGASPTCDTAGVLGPAVMMVAAMQAGAAIKVLSGNEDAVARELREFDLWTGLDRRIDVSRMADRACPCCMLHRYEFLEGGRSGGTAVLCGRDSVQVSPGGGGGGEARLDLVRLAEVLGAHGTFNAGRFALRGMLAEERGEGGAGIGLTVFADGRAIVQGTTDAARARAIYARYVGG